MRWLLRSKIHRATVTRADLDYVGSITLNDALIERVGLWPGEKVLVVSNSLPKPSWWTEPIGTSATCDRRIPLPASPIGNLTLSGRGITLTGNTPSSDRRTARTCA